MARRFVILSGPSCVGKGPLVAAVSRFHPDVRCDPVPVIKSRESRPQGPRPEEKGIWDDPDYFRTKQEILALASDERYLVGDCRGLPQAIDLARVEASQAPLLFTEAYHTLGAQLRSSAFLKDVQVTAVFVSPLGAQEIADLKQCGVDLEAYLAHVMLGKLVARLRHQGGALTDREAADLAGRARDAVSELRSAASYSCVIVNHDGEGNPDWHRLPNGVFTSEPEGDAARAVTAFVKLLSGSGDAQVERWDESAPQLAPKVSLDDGGAGLRRCA